MSYEYYSSVALVSSVVVYALAMFAHAAEWASARGIPAVEAVRERELVTVGADAPAADRPAPSRPVDDPDDATPRRRVEQFGRIGLMLTVVGFLLSLAGVLARAVAAQRAPWGNMFEFTTTAMVFVVAAYLLMVWRAGIRWLGLPLTLLATVANGLAVTVFYVAVAPLVPALHSVWFLIHIVAAAIAGAAFNIGGLMSILYLLRCPWHGSARPVLAYYIAITIP